MAFQIITIYNVIPELIAFVEAESRAAVKRTADDIAERARQLCPVDTGQLRGSISTASNVAGKSAEITVGAEYAAYVEYGTYKMAAQPFLTPACEDNKDAFFDRVGKGCFARFGS